MAAHSMHVGALAALGRKYLLGIDGFQQNIFEAFRLLKLSAVGKDPVGMFLFGKMIIDHPNVNFNQLVTNCCISGFACRHSTTRLNTFCQLCESTIDEAHLACEACDFDICRDCESIMPSLEDITATVVRSRSFFMESIQAIQIQIENKEFIPERDVDLSKCHSFYLTSLTEFGSQPFASTKFNPSIPNYKVERFISARCRRHMQSAEELLKFPSFLQSTGSPDTKIQEAVQMVANAASLAVADAQYFYALYLATGFHVSPDPERSLFFLSEAANANHSDAQAKLGEMYLRGIAPADKDLTQAIRLLKLAASAQVPSAMFLLGECLELGVGIEANASEAAAWYGRAADKGHTESQYQYAICLEHGQGVPLDYNRAIEYYSMAARVDHVMSQSRLAKHLQTTDIAEAIKLYRIAAAGGDSNAQFDLAVLLLTGYGPDTKDEFEAVVFFNSAVQQNHPRASYYLGCCRGIGLGCDIDVQESRKLLDFAAKHQIAAAMHDLAVSFTKSNDMTLAFPLYEAAFKAKYSEASYALATMHFHGQGVLPDLPSAYKYFQVGYQQGSARCLFGSAYCLLYGVGTEPDVSTGSAEMEKCARQGNPFAQFFMGMCLKSGRGFAINDVASTYWFRLSARQGFANAQKMMMCAFQSDESISADEMTNTSVFIPRAHRFSLELASAAHYYENCPNSSVVIHQGLACFSLLLSRTLFLIEVVCCR
jgi:TPR repeat protein